MELIIPDNVLKSFQEMYEALADERIPFSVARGYTEKFCRDFVDFLSEDYFGTPCTQPFKLKFKDQMYSYLNEKHDTITIGTKTTMSRQSLAARIALDAVHESVHFCQYNFFQAHRPTRAQSYVTALFHNIMATRVHLEHDGYTSHRSATPYMRPSLDGFQADMYRAQPAELQANMLSLAFLKTARERMPEHIQSDFWLKRIISRVEQTSSFDALSNRFAQTHQYSLPSMVSKSILNACRGTGYQIESNVAQFFDSELMKQLSGHDRRHLEGFSITSRAAEVPEIIDENRTICQVSDVTDPQSQKSLEELLLSDALIISNGESGLQLLLDDKTHDVSSKDIEEFLFCIGEKRFAELTKADPEPELDELALSLE